MSDVATKRKYLRLDNRTWAEIEGLWEGGDCSLQDLEDRFGVSRRTLQSHFAKRGSRKGSKASELAATVKAEVLSEILADPEDLVKRAKTARERAYSNAVLLEELVTTQLMMVQKDPTQAPKLASALKGMSLAAAALERIQDMKSKALGLDEHVDSEELTVLTFEDLTEKEISAMRDQEENEDDEIETGATLNPHSDDDVVMVDLQEEELVPEVPAPTIAAPSGPRLVRGAN